MGWPLAGLAQTQFLAQQDHAAENHPSTLRPTSLSQSASYPTHSHRPNLVPHLHPARVLRMSLPGTPRAPPTLANSIQRMLQNQEVVASIAAVCVASISMTVFNKVSTDDPAEVMGSGGGAVCRPRRRLRDEPS